MDSNNGVLRVKRLFCRQKKQTSLTVDNMSNWSNRTTINNITNENKFVLFRLNQKYNHGTFTLKFVLKSLGLLVLMYSFSLFYNILQIITIVFPK
jgi:hypothetical protein